MKKKNKLQKFIEYLEYNQQWKKEYKPTFEEILQKAREIQEEKS